MEGEADVYSLTSVETFTGKHIYVFQHGSPEHSFFAPEREREKTNCVFH